MLTYAKRLDVNDRGPHLDLCRTSLDMGREKKWSRHASNISTTNIILKLSIR